MPYESKDNLSEDVALALSSESVRPDPDVIGCLDRTSQPAISVLGLYQ